MLDLSLKDLTIPLVAGGVGWFTNWIAIKMTFYPVRFVGIPPYLGWQGIIPSKTVKMATIFVDETMAKLGNLKEVFNELDPKVISQHITHHIEPFLNEITDEIMHETEPTVWDNLPQIVKNNIYKNVKKNLPQLVDNLLLDISEKIEDLVDLKELIINKLVKHPELLNKLFMESGQKEFKFLVNSGFIFGTLFGLIQLAVWKIYPKPWILPLFGALVGYITNYIAINLIFRPLYPVKLGPFTIQGLFLKRQNEVAKVWSKIVTREIFTIKLLVEGMIKGSKSKKTRQLIKKHLRPLVDKAVGTIRPLAQLTVGIENYSKIKDKVAEIAVDVSIEPFDDPVFIEDRAKVMERFLTHRMTQLPPEEFQGLLRPCFKEDEFKVILLGGILGFLAGIAQWVWVFAPKR